MLNVKSKMKPDISGPYNSEGPYKRIDLWLS